MKTFARVIALLLLLLWTLVLDVYHAGVYPPPKVNLAETGRGVWMDRREVGINQLVLEGSPFARGRKAGELTGPLLLAQEEALVAQLNQILPSRILIQGMVLAAISWFQGAEEYIDSEFAEEMYGVSLSAPKRFDYLADGFTRQVAYHGLHEVGQMMVDQGFEDMGCTVVAIPYGGHFVIGRNFDFEGGRIFDTEKIMKWVFPEHGNAFVSVIWAGMVGAVTGVNDKGLYISLNAGGSSDKRRLGTPTTLAVAKMLEQASDVEQALKILEATQVFITDIYVIEDAGGNLVRVEKSPARMAVIPLKQASIVTNHLIGKEFSGDETNEFRMRELTTIAREKRGYDLLQAFTPARDSDEASLQALSVLRDKGVDAFGQRLNLSNRRAIDALIATHSVVYDPLAKRLYVSQGPGVSGVFHGYDLDLSFRSRTPSQAKDLPADPLVSAETFAVVKDANLRISRAHREIQFHGCDAGLEALRQIPLEWQQQAPYFEALGDGLECKGRLEEARAAWTKALALNPAYARELRQLEKSLAK